MFSHQNEQPNIVKQGERNLLDFECLHPKFNGDVLQKKRKEPLKCLPNCFSPRFSQHGVESQAYFKAYWYKYWYKWTVDPELASTRNTLKQFGIPKKNSGNPRNYHNFVKFFNVI